MVSARSVMLAMCLVCSAAGAVAGELVLIVNRANPINDISAELLKKFYTGEEITWPGGERIALVELKDNNPLTAYFSDKILHMDLQRKSKLWAVKAFGSDVKPPYKYSSEAAVVGFVSSNPNAMGYVSPGGVDNTVKVITLDGSREF